MPLMVLVAKQMGVGEMWEKILFMLLAVTSEV